MKMKIKYQFLVVALCCFVQISLAQNRRAERIAFEEADSYIAYGDYKTAAEQFEQLHQKDRDNLTVAYKLGISYYHLEEYNKAKPLFIQSLATYEDAKYYLAAIAHFNFSLDEAERYLTDINLAESNVGVDDINRLMEQINYAKEQLSNPVDVSIYNIGVEINSEYPDYVPLITANEEYIYFTSRRPSPQHMSLDPSNQYYEDIYYAKNTYGNWRKALPLDDINTEKHDACVGISPNGNTLYLYKSNVNLIGGDLYQSQKIDGKWSTPLKLSNKINGEFSVEKSASISEDGRTLYFSSNREGGFGGYDLYRVKKLPNGEWSEAMNLGKDINTEYDEDAPFIHPDGKTLYFSSKGHDNMGGFDIFKSTISEMGIWTEVENLAYPINSTSHDIYFVISENGHRGYYSSAKPGGNGEQDIYVIDYLEKSLQQSIIRAYIPELLGKDNGLKNLQATLYKVDSNEAVGYYTPNLRTASFIFTVDPNVAYLLKIEADKKLLYQKELKFTTQDILDTQNLIIHFQKSN